MLHEHSTLAHDQRMEALLTPRHVCALLISFHMLKCVCAGDPFPSLSNLHSRRSPEQDKIRLVQ